MGAHASLLLSPGAALGLPFPASLFPVFLSCCSGGLRKIIYAFGLGYGLCMFAGGFATLSQAPTSTWSTCGCSLYMAYGGRLVSFLLRRQLSDVYNSSKHGAELNAKMEKTPLVVNTFVCVFVSLTQIATTYALQPVALASNMPVAGYASLGIGWLGLLLETVADEEKLAAKKSQPDAPVMTGTYSIVRHSNYLGEILFWAGNMGAAQIALPSKSPLLERVGGAVGPILMIWVMLNAAKTLDKKGIDKYKDNVAYKAYVARTKSLFPWIY
eukprot:TRINITY_DN33400_c0_g1_i1.p1 TRINITY_DN33400_c0_g1~~TRINITY_DN33400_c0_g1_i1.p1  ORF type:complete len:286 (+),score=28.83 TRINITY_DN33400_c0_g1_i1:51-860(+)